MLRATDRSAIVSFRRSAENAITTHKFSAFITDGPGPPLFNPRALSQDYQECVQSVPTLLVPVAGGRAKPAVVWIVRGSMSCQAAISILDGGKAARS